LLPAAYLRLLLLQAGFVSVLRGVPASDPPGKYLSFRYPVRPKVVKTQKKSERLNANDIQVSRW
jgi:hypothetical protein